MRISIDDSLNIDIRFQKLSKIIGDEEKAMGRMVALFRLGMKFHSEKKLIPEEYINYGNFEPVVECGLLIKEENGYYVCGAEKYFNWYHDIAETRSLAGKRSAEVRKEKYGTSQPSRTKNCVREETSNKIEQNTEQNRTARTTSNANTNTNTNTNTINTISLSDSTNLEKENEDLSISKSSPLNKPKKDEYTWQFEELWEYYPKKDAKKSGSIKYERLSEKDKGIALKNILERSVSDLSWKKHIEEGTINFIPNLATFIHQRRFEDEIQVITPKALSKPNPHFRSNPQNTPSKDEQEAIRLRAHKQWLETKKRNDSLDRERTHIFAKMPEINKITKERELNVPRKLSEQEFSDRKQALRDQIKNILPSESVH